jgi:hypothetical protein
MFAEDAPVLQTPSDIWSWYDYLQNLVITYLPYCVYRAMAALEVSDCSFRPFNA